MMVQLVTFLAVVFALVVLVLQNLTPSLALVVLGRSMGLLPLSLWMLIAIAIGALFTLITYQLMPKQRSYRPMGTRLPDAPVPTPSNRFVDPSPPPIASPNRFEKNSQQPTADRPRKSPYDSDWGNFKAPEQWDDWEPQQADFREQSTSREPVADTVQDIESGWGDDGEFTQSRRPLDRDDIPPDTGWDENSPAYGDRSRDDYRPEQRTYDEGWLYGSEPPTSSPADPPASNDPDSEPEDVYDANYRVIIPPYDPNDT